MDARGGRIYLTFSDASFSFTDVADWKAFAKKLQAEDAPLSKRIMAAMGPEMPSRLKRILAGKEPATVFASNGGRRIDPRFAQAMNELIEAPDLSPETASLPEEARAHANRRLINQFFGSAMKPMAEDALYVLDGHTGKFLKSCPVPLGGAVKAIDEHRILVISGGTTVLAVDPASGQSSPVIKGLVNATGITADSAGNIYVSLDEPDMQVAVFDSAGKETKRIGRKDGRALLGAWQEDGMLHPAGIAVDKLGKLWVMERDRHPKRVSVWSLADGKFVKDFYGPTHYGASGSAINPRDPNLMVGVGCEWRMDPATGKSVCLGAFDRQYHEFATFREGPTASFISSPLPASTAGAPWKSSSGSATPTTSNVPNSAAEDPRSAGSAKTVLWTDVNGDGKEQADEVQQQSGALLAAGSNGWSINLGPDMTIYPFDTASKQLKALAVEGFTAAGAPKYDLAKAKVMPEAMSDGYMTNSSCAVPSADNKRILINLAAQEPSRRLPLDVL